jgi:hypothetical protein
MDVDVLGQDEKTCLAGVKSSSQSSTPMQVSTVLITQSPKGALIWKGKVVYDRGSSKLMTNLLRDSLNNPWEEMIFPLSVLHPGSKVPHLAVVSIVG